MPAEAWDAHAHVIGDPKRFPFWIGRDYTPEAAPLDEYLSMLDRYGIARGVLVQPSAYGHDNSCLLDALDRAHSRLFGVVVPPPDATANDFAAMHRRGVRGVRCNLINPGGLSAETIAGWQPLLRALGWHVELHVAIEEIPDLAAFISQFGVPVVVDHMGRPSPGRVDPMSPPLRALIDLVRDEACYVKLSAPYRLSREAPWRDVAPLVQALVAANPRACLWGSDWPHVLTRGPVRMDDLFGALQVWCPDERVRAVVAGDAARALFGS